MSDETQHQWNSGFRAGAALTLVTVAILGGVLYLSHRDAEATERCLQIGGQTWDEGHHCVIGGKVVSTR